MNRIKEAIRRSDKKQFEVAQMLGIRPDSMSTAIARKTLTVDQLEKISEFISVPISDMFSSNQQTICPYCKNQIKIEK